MIGAVTLFAIAGPFIALAVRHALGRFFTCRSGDGGVPSAYHWGYQPDFALVLDRRFRTPRLGWWLAAPFISIGKWVLEGGSSCPGGLGSPPPLASGQCLLTNRFPAPNARRQAWWRHHRCGNLTNSRSGLPCLAPSSYCAPALLVVAAPPPPAFEGCANAMTCPLIWPPMATWDLAAR